MSKRIAGNIEGNKENLHLKNRALIRQAREARQSLELEGLEDPIDPHAHARHAKWLARSSRKPAVSRDSFKTTSNDPLEGDSIVSLPRNNRFSNFSFNHLLGFSLGRRLSLLSPESNNKQQRSHFIEGLIGGLSNTFLKDLSNPEMSSLKIKKTDGHEHLRQYFSPLRKVGDKDSSDWASRGILISTLENLSKMHPSTLAKRIKNSKITQSIVKSLSNFWKSLTNNTKETTGQFNPILAAI